MKNTRFYDVGSKLILGVAVLISLSGCIFESPPLGIFYWRVIADQTHPAGDGEIYTIKADNTSRTFMLKRYAEKKQLWGQEITVELDADDSNISDNVTLTVAGATENERRAAVLVRASNRIFVRVYDQSGNLLQQAEQSIPGSTTVKQVFNKEGNKLFITTYSAFNATSDLIVYELENTQLAERFHLNAALKSPTLVVANNGAVIKVNDKWVVGVDENWQQRWQITPPDGVDYGALLSHNVTTIITQGDPIPGINFIDRASGNIKFVATAKTPNVDGFGVDGNPYILEIGDKEYIKKIDSDGQILFQSKTTYNANHRIYAIRELASGERVVLSNQPDYLEYFATRGRSVIDWLAADGTKMRSYTPRRTVNYPYPCLFCGSSEDTPGYYLTDVYIAADGDMFASGDYSLLFRLSSSTSFWSSHNFFGKVDLSKADQ